MYVKTFRYLIIVFIFRSPLKDISNNLSITGKNINFSYKEDLPILKNINFNINPSEIVALVGT